MVKKTDSNVQEKEEISRFQKEIHTLPDEIKQKLLEKEKHFKPLIEAIKQKSMGKDMGFYITPEISVVQGRPQPNFDKITLHFLLDDFEKPIVEFQPKILLGEEFNALLSESIQRDEHGQNYSVFTLKADSSITFQGGSISILRENCFDSIYDDLKHLGTSFIYEDSRGFISALKSIDIHRNMLLQKFEKYVVVYAGAGSWLRGEKSNDFDVFVVVDDTDVKRMPRMQVKEQLTRIIWQMAQEVAQITGINIHCQVYLLTDFWDALKDAHPVMFTFLRDGVPFYDRGLYNSWKELLKLGKIRPSPEAIDMHMNVAFQLIDRANKTMLDIMMNDVYYAVLNPAQAILMLKGFNPTTPKETIKIFKEVLLEKEKCVSKKDVEILEKTVQTFKTIEHDKSFQLKGKDLDTFLKNADSFLKNMKKMFEEVTDEKTKESVVSAYDEFINQLRTLPGFADLKEEELLKEFEERYVHSKVLKPFVKSSLKSILKAKKDFDSGKITTTEVNKTLKEIRNVLAEVKDYRDRTLMSELSKRKLRLTYEPNKQCEIFNYDGVLYLYDLSSQNYFSIDLEKKTFSSAAKTENDFVDTSKFTSISLSSELLELIKKHFKVKELQF
jgi:uncharacterized protein (UPF0332 family)